MGFLKINEIEQAILKVNLRRISNLSTRTHGFFDDLVQMFTCNVHSSFLQVKALLNLLPRLEYPLSQSSPAHSTALTDCTLHTSDFMSTPPSPHTSHCHIPLSHDHSVEKCFECQGLCGMHSSQKHFLNTGSMDSIHQVSS